MSEVYTPTTEQVRRYWQYGANAWADVDAAYHLKLANPRALANTIPYRGGLGLRHLPDGITAQIIETLGEPQ